MNLIVSTETERQKKFGKASQTRQRNINNVQGVKFTTVDGEQPVETGPTSKREESAQAR
jgi:hypothetical protein